jgi:hypothetical protein
MPGDRGDEGVELGLVDQLIFYSVSDNSIEFLSCHITHLTVCGFSC